MKKTNFALWILTAVSTLTIVSCSKEDMKTGAKPAEFQAAEGQVTGVINAAAKYTLVKRGYDSIAYHADGRIASVQSPMGKTVYTYGGFGEIYAKTISGNQVDRLDTFKTNPDGKVFWSREKAFTYYSGGTVVVDKVSKYEYDAGGHLIKKYNVHLPNEATTFQYNAAGDLTDVWSMDKNGVVIAHSVIGYTFGIGNPQITDRFPFVQSFTYLHHPYLGMYGTLSKHLKGSVTHKNPGSSPTTYLYSYILDQNNVVTMEKMKIQNNSYKKDIPYSWNISYRGVQQPVQPIR
ncbi:MAG TPA: hypothetical protein VHK69_15270 [Chitinophagaceae bacterium]|jgi:hypothetical protein|nr:hypothetical protein [Chitinophagaceae bacterium]